MIDWKYALAFVLTSCVATWFIARRFWPRAQPSDLWQRATTRQIDFGRATLPEPGSARSAQSRLDKLRSYASNAEAHEAAASAFVRDEVQYAKHDPAEGLPPPVPEIAKRKVSP